MGTTQDFYETLQLQRSADAVEIKKAYRRLALKYHPDKDASDSAKKAFARIAEAYDVLSNTARKGVYDLHGEEGLKATSDDSFFGGGMSRSNIDPMYVFEQFFGTANPFAAVMDAASVMKGHGTGPKEVPGAATAYTLELTLEELFTGVKKIVQHRKRNVKANGQEEVSERQLVVDVPPSSVDGQRFVFEQKAGEGGDPVVVVVSQLPHPLYKRMDASQGGDFDVAHQARVPIVKALCGTTLHLKSLDGRALAIPVPEIITCGATKVMKDHGMRRPDGTFGDLVIFFEIVFPKSFSDVQKTLLRAAFFLPEKRTPEQAAAAKAFARAFEDPQLGWARNA